MLNIETKQTNNIINKKLAINNLKKWIFVAFNKFNQ